MRWLNALLDGLAAGEPMVWVSVARLHGSSPREVGASMVVGAHRQADTIGGGHLEWQAIAQARQLLSASTATQPPASAATIWARGWASAAAAWCGCCLR